MTFLAMAPSLDYGFLQWDDPIYVTENHQIHDLTLQAIARDFSLIVGGNYHPLTMISLAFDYHFWRLNPRGYHITNVALHVANTLAVYWLFALLTGSVAIAAMTALFFGIHPLHVESVAWVSERKDLLYVFFYLVACVAYVLWLRSRAGRKGYYAASLALFVFSLLSKGMAVTLPGALLLIDFYLQRRVSWKQRLLEKAPFFALSLAFGIVAIVAQRSGGAIGDLASLPLYERIFIACYGYLSYLAKAIVPVGLSAFYPYPPSAGHGLSPLFWIAPLVVLGTGLLVYRSRVRGREVIFGALFYSLNVALVLQMIPVGRAIIADRYTYLAYVGVGFIIAWGVRRVTQGSWAKRTGLGWAAAAATAVFGASLLFAARVRCEVWSDNVKLWTDVIEKHPRTAFAYKNRAITYRERGDLELAEADLDRSLTLDPKDAGAWSNRGNLFYARGEGERALQDLDRAVALDPRMAEAWSSRGAVRASLGRYEQALADFDRAIELKSDLADAILNRANTLFALRLYDRARSGYDTYIAWEPDDPRGHFCRGLERATLGDYVGAVEDFGSALRLQPRFPLAFYSRSKALAALGHADAALRDALEAQKLGFPVEHGYLESLARGIQGH